MVELVDREVEEVEVVVESVVEVDEEELVLLVEVDRLVD